MGRLKSFLGRINNKMLLYDGLLVRRPDHVGLLFAAGVHVLVRPCHRSEVAIRLDDVPSIRKMTLQALIRRLKSRFWVRLSTR